IVLKTPASLQQTLPELHLTSGEISIVGTTLAAKNLLLSGAGGQGQIDGSWDWPIGSAKLQAAWRDVQLPRGIAQQGQLNASLTTPWPGAPQIAANLFSGGKLKSGEAWEATIDLSGITKPPPRQFGDLPATLPADGAAKEFEWKLTAPSLAWHGKEPVTLKDVVARLRSRGTILDLEE